MGYEFKSTGSNSRGMGLTLGVSNSNPQIASWNERVTSSNLRVTSLVCFAWELPLQTKHSA